MVKVDIFNKEKEFDEKVEEIVKVINDEKDQKTREIRIRELFSEIKRAYLQAHFDAVTDSLTGCFNKKHIREIFHFQYATAKRTKQYFTLLVLNIDYLKYINDTYGHNIGDEIIKAIAQAVIAAVRESDIVFRFGGDEFVLFCSHNEQNGAQKIALRVNEGISQIKVLKNFTPSVTAGFVSYDTKDQPNRSYNELFKSADEVLYRNKHNRKPPDFLTPKK